MSAELLRRAAGEIRADMDKHKQEHYGRRLRNRVQASYLVADWLDHVATALESDDTEGVLGLGEPTDARAVARAYLGEVAS